MSPSRRTSGCNATWRQWTGPPVQPTRHRHLQCVYLAVVARNIRLLALFPHTQPTVTIRTRWRQFCSTSRFFFFFFVRFISIIFQLTTLVFAAVLVQPLSVSDAIILISEQWRLSQLAAMDLHYRHQLYRKPHNRILFGLQKLYRLPPRKILRIY